MAGVYSAPVLSFPPHSAPSRGSRSVENGLRCLALAVLLAVSAGPALAHGAHSFLMLRVDERLAREPENADLWFQRAVLEFEHEDWNSAATDFAKVEQYAPGKFPVLWWQGRVLDNQGKPAEAKIALDAFLAATPDHSGALTSRGRVFAKLGDNDASLADFRAALARCPDPQPDLILEVAEALADHGFARESVTVLEAGIMRLGPVPSLQLKILDVEVDAGEYAAALARLGAMQASASRPEPWMEKRASILAEAGRIDESRAAWRSLISHLNSLPASERDSHAMIHFSERAHQALLALAPDGSPSLFVTPARSTDLSR